MTASKQIEKNKKTKNNQKRPKKLRVRKFPILLRILLVLILLIVALIVGLMVGYSVLGDGAALDVLDKETWQHIIDIVKKEK